MLVAVQQYVACGALQLLQVVVLGSHTVLINQWARL